LRNSPLIIVYDSLQMWVRFGSGKPGQRTP
jgi:hypothetical protein